MAYNQTYPKSVQAYGATQTGARGDLKAKAEAVLASMPDLRFVDVFLTDLNGVLRGKRLPAGQALKIFDPSLRMPLSLVGLDIWGEDVMDNGLILEAGDSDGLCLPFEPGLISVPWAGQKTAQVSVMMAQADGSPFLADPRQLLSKIQQRLNDSGRFPVAALEVEFYLLEDAPTTEPSSGSKPALQRFGNLCDMGQLNAKAAFLDELYQTCETQDVELGALVKESGPGQFELNLHHKKDVVAAADQVILLRRAIKGIAQKHGLIASFMAKPFGERAGSGMHAHVSMLDADGNNLFDQVSAPGRPNNLEQAVAGLLAAAPQSMIFFAPHYNSAKRFKQNAHAPARASWGYDNRLAAIRIPADVGKNRRFEHRIAGADANPYLVMAALLAGAQYGLDNKLVPPPPLTGNKFRDTDTALQAAWGAAVSDYETGNILAPQFGELFTTVFTTCKRQEIETVSNQISEFEYFSYLRAF